MDHEKIIDYLYLLVQAFFFYGIIMLGFKLIDVKKSGNMYTCGVYEACASSHGSLDVKKVADDNYVYTCSITYK